MSRLYEVWHTRDGFTKQITKFFVTDATEEEHTDGIDRTVATFPVTRFADLARQQERANRFCALLNGHLSYNITDKGREHQAAVADRIARRKEQERIDAQERNEAALAQAKKAADDALANAMTRASQHIEVAPTQEKPVKRGWFSRLRGEAS